MSEQELSDSTSRNSIEQYRRLITSDVGILDTLLLDIIRRRPFQTQRRNTARAVTTRLSQRTEILRHLLRERTVEQETSTQTDTTLTDSDTTDSESSRNFQFEQLGDTSVAAFRAAIRAEAVVLAVADLLLLGTISAEISNFHDLASSSSPDRLIVDTILRRHYSSVLHCRYSSFSEQVRLSLALRRSRHDE
jgi:hypothetical protein